MDACPRRHSQEVKPFIPPVHNKRVFRKPRTVAKLLQGPPSHSQHDSATNSPPFPSSFPKSARSFLIPNLTASPIYVGCDVENIDIAQIWRGGHTVHSIGDGKCTVSCGRGGAETYMQVRGYMTGRQSQYQTLFNSIFALHNVLFTIGPSLLCQPSPASHSGIYRFT